MSEIKNNLPGPKPSSLFDENSKSHIKRGAVKNQTRMLLIVFGVVAVGIVALVLVLSKGPDSFTASGYQSATIQQGRWTDQLELSAVAELQDTRAVSAPETGVMVHLAVEEGADVKKGQVLAILDPQDLETTLTSLEPNVTASQLALDKIIAQYKYTVSSDQQNVSGAARALDAAQRAYDLALKQFNAGSLSQDDLSSAKDVLDDARDKNDAAKIQVQQDAEMYTLNVKSAQADLAKVQSDVADLKRRIASCTVTSPINGRVMQIDDAARETGALMSQYASIMSVADVSHALLKAKLPENNAAQVKAGMSLNIASDSGTVPGVVDRVGVVVLTDDTTYGSYLDLYARAKDPAVTFRSGATASLDMELGARDNVLYVTRGPWFTGSSQNYVFKIVGNSAVKTKVAIGSSTPDLVEIQSGLQKGDRIVSTSYSAFASYDSIQLSGAKQ